MKSSIIVCIPARYDSSRLPGKPLAEINGKALVLHVYDKVHAVIEKVYVATDDQRIVDEVIRGNGQVILTDPSHQTGTDRCAEAMESISKDLDQDSVIINVQGDEPFIPTELLFELEKKFSDKSVQIATCVHKITDQNTINNPNRVKVVLNKNNEALYFSRSVIPHQKLDNKTPSEHYQHIGVYAFRWSTLQKIVKLESSKLELQESLEQLRWLENGYSIHCIITDYNGFGIDTEHDLIKAREILGKI